MAEGWTVPQIWKDERAYIIAGGSSVPREWLKAHKLPGRVLAIKDAALLVPDADCLFYADHHFHRDRADVFNAYTGPLIVKRTVHDDVPPQVRQVHRKRADKSKINGLSRQPDTLGGHDSGGSAINLAFHFGVKEIVLIGFDLRGAHWNLVSHPLPRARIRTHNLHRDSIDAMAAPMQEAGVTVWNTSLISNLIGFPRVPLASLV